MLEDKQEKLLKLEDRQKKLLKEVNKRIMIVGKFTCNDENQVRFLNFKNRNSNKLKQDMGKLTREDFFRVVKPEVVSSNDSFHYLGTDVWFNFCNLGRPFDNKDAMKTFQIPHDSALLKTKNFIGCSKIASIQKKGLEILKELVEDLNFLANFYHPNFGRALLFFAQEYVYKHADNNPKQKVGETVHSISPSEWEEAIENDPVLNKLIIRFLTCYSADERQCLSAFKKRIKKGPVFRSKIDKKKSTLTRNPDQAGILVEALSACKKALCSLDVSDETYMDVSNSTGYEWLESFNDDEFFGFDVPSIDNERKIDNASFQANFNAFLKISAKVHRFIRSSALHPFVFSGLMSKYVTTSREIGGISEIASKVCELSVKGKKVVAGPKKQQKYMDDLKKYSIVNSKIEEKLKNALQDDIKIFEDQLIIVKDRAKKQINPDLSFTADALKKMLTNTFVNLGLLTGGPILEMHEKNKKIVERLSQYYNLILSSSASTVEELKKDLITYAIDDDELNETEFIGKIFKIEPADPIKDKLQDIIMEKYIEEYGKKSVDDFATRVLKDIGPFKESIKTLRNVYAENLENEVRSESKSDAGSPTQIAGCVWKWDDKKYKELQTELENKSNKTDHESEHELNTTILGEREDNYKASSHVKKTKLYPTTKKFWGSLKASGIDEDVIERSKDKSKIEIEVKIKEDDDEEEINNFGIITLSGNSLKKPDNLSDQEDDVSFWINETQLDLRIEDFEDTDLCWNKLEELGIDIKDAKEANKPKPIKISIQNDETNDAGSIIICGDTVEILGDLTDNETLKFVQDNKEIPIDKDIINGLDAAKDQQDCHVKYSDFRGLAKIQKKIHKIYYKEDHPAKETVRPFLRSLIFGEYLLSTPLENTELGSLHTSINLGIIQRIIQYFGVLDKSKPQVFEYGIDSEGDEDIKGLLEKIEIDEIIPLPKKNEDAKNTLSHYISYQYKLSKSLTEIENYLTELNEIGDFFDAVKNTDLEVIVLDGTLDQHSQDEEVKKDLKRFFACSKPPLFVYLTRQTIDNDNNIDMNNFLETLNEVCEFPASRHPNLQIPIFVTPFELKNTYCSVLTNNMEMIPLPKLIDTTDRSNLDSLIVDKVIQEQPYLLLCASLILNNAKFGKIIKTNDNARKEPWCEKVIGYPPEEDDLIIKLFGEAWFRNDYLMDTLILNKLINYIRLLRVNDTKSILKKILHSVNNEVFINSTLIGLHSSLENLTPSFYILAAGNKQLIQAITGTDFVDPADGMFWERNIGSGGKKDFMNQEWLKGVLSFIREKP